jgi:dipeptidyl aminopeptidase/acylaminoacyl peptidase
MQDIPFRYYYRGSDGYGRDFRTGIYRLWAEKIYQIKSGQKYLVDNFNVD